MKAVTQFTSFHFQLKYNYMVFTFPGFLSCILKMCFFFFLTLVVGVPPQHIKTTFSISLVLPVCV